MYIYISKLIAGYGRLREVTGGYGRLRGLHILETLHIDSRLRIALVTGGYGSLREVTGSYGRLRKVMGGCGRLRVRQIHRDSRDSSLRF